MPGGTNPSGKGGSEFLEGPHLPVSRQWLELLQRWKREQPEWQPEVISAVPLKRKGEPSQEDTVRAKRLCLCQCTPKFDHVLLQKIPQSFMRY